MATPERPLSPHLQVYRPQLTSLLSVTHRGSGMLLVVGALLVAWWFWSVAAGGESYETARAFFGSWFGQLLLLGWVLSTFYHLCNGIRHLLWDAGFGFEIGKLYTSGKIVLAATVLLTLAAWLVKLA